MNKYLADNFSDKLIPTDIPLQYYDFGRYVTKERMLTFWYQLKEVLSKKPGNLLEIGIGSKIVSGVIRELGIDLTTVDINPTLKLDYVVAVQNLSDKFKPASFDLILCARVLHHIPFSDFEIAIRQMAEITKKYVILTLPTDDLRLYFSMRITSRRSIIYSLKLPLFIKRVTLRLLRKDKTYYSKLWKIDASKDYSLSKIKKVIENYFIIEKSYPVPEDRSHFIFVLMKR